MKLLSLSCFAILTITATGLTQAADQSVPRYKDTTTMVVDGGVLNVITGQDNLRVDLISGESELQAEGSTVTEWVNEGIRNSSNERASNVKGIRYLQVFGKDGPAYVEVACSALATAVASATAHAVAQCNAYGGTSLQCSNARDALNDTVSDLNHCLRNIQQEK